MPRFPTEVIQRIIEEVGFEYGPRLKEYITTFKALNSIIELKPIIAKYISIWILYPSDVQFNYLRHSETLRSLRDCTDSFFIFTNDEPVEFTFEPNLDKVFECGPLIFDVHNYLGMKLKDGLNLGIQNIDVVVEHLILLSDKRPKRILELVLPNSKDEVSEIAECEASWISNHTYRFESVITKRHDHLEGIAGVRNWARNRKLPVEERYNVPIDHQIFNWAYLSDFDEYPFNEIFRKLDFLEPLSVHCLKVACEFWGPAPFLDRLSCEEVGDVDDFSKKLKKCRIDLWSDYQNQLFLSEYYRINLAAYHDLIETLTSEQWK